MGMLPLKDLFCNRKIEINIDLSEVKILFEGFKLPTLALQNL
jgi:hypothetical protein